MSGIRFLIALLFLFAGLEGQLQASASQALPADHSRTPTDILTNLNSKTSADKMTSTAPDRVQGILAERVIEMSPRLSHNLLMQNLRPPSMIQGLADGFRVSGCSPPLCECCEAPIIIY